MPTKEYKVGYGKPPTQTQFKRGVSGNKSGRPKGAKNFATLFHKELSRRVSVSENGKRCTITKMEAAIKQIANRAATGDAKAIQILTNLSREFGDLNQPDLAKPPTIRRFTLNIFDRDRTTGQLVLKSTKAADRNDDNQNNNSA
jgi:hypothetical protein